MNLLLYLSVCDARWLESECAVALYSKLLVYLQLYRVSYATNL